MTSASKQITIAIVSSLLGALIAFIASSAMGLFQKTVSETQVHEVAKSFINDENSRNVLLDKMKQSEHFKGQKGDQGLKGDTGERGPAGPGVKLLAMVIVKEGKIESSSYGVSYEPDTGVVSFPNPDNLKFVPLISNFGDTGHDTYMTSTHFLRKEFVAPNKFKVWRTAQDTGGRNWAPDSFTAIAIGF